MAKKLKFLIPEIGYFPNEIFKNRSQWHVAKVEKSPSVKKSSDALFITLETEKISGFFVKVKQGKTLEIAHTRILVV